MSSLWWLVLGLLAGWLIELVIDYRYWRRRARIEAARLAELEASLNARLQTLERRQAEQDQRGDELNALQASLAARDAELLGAARRIDERAEEVLRLEQAMDKRRADLDRMGLALNEREKDIAGRDSKLKVAEADYGARHEALQAAEADVARRVAVVSNRESAMQNWEARILAREHELSDKEADLVREAAAAAELRAELDATRNLLCRQYRTPEGTDDLAAIEGIEPKIVRLLHDAGIRTFERLSETSLGELTRIVEAGGPRLGLVDPLTWAEQAACLVNGDYIAFERMKDELRRDNRQDAALLQMPSNLDALRDGTADPIAERRIEENANASPGAASEGDASVEAGVETKSRADAQAAPEIVAGADPETAARAYPESTARAYPEPAARADAEAVTEADADNDPKADAEAVAPSHVGAVPLAQPSAGATAEVTAAVHRHLRQSERD